METMFEKFQALPFDKSLLGLEPGKVETPYFCCPVGAVPIGFEGCILYCFLPGYGETVFAVNPESCADTYVYPLAADFTDFLRLILACGTANPAEQIAWMDREQFARHLAEEQNLLTPEQKDAAALLRRELGLSAMEAPFAYVKALQADFDRSKIVYSDEYYEVLGIQHGDQ